MREHPVPQDVTGYQFHIIGNMTIKQFAEVLAGVLIAVLIFSTNLPDIIKWPLVAISAGLGFLAAFVPFEEQPLDHWIIVFVTTLYKPTQFYWHREERVPDPFKFKPSDPNREETYEVDLSPVRKQRLRDYMFSYQETEQLSAYDVYEQNRMSDILGSFTSVQVSVGQSQPLKPNLDVRPRAISQNSGFYQDYLNSLEKDKLTDRFEDITVQPQTQQQAVQEKQVLTTNQVAQQVEVPEMQNVSTTTPAEQAQAEETATKAMMTEEPSTAFVEHQSTNQFIDSSQLQDAQTNVSLPFPALPEEPNKPVGMVLTPNNDLLSGALVEIRNTAGQIVRAVKANSLGQFFITTPLEKGVYVIHTEKEGYSFHDQELTIQNKVVPPLEIRSVV